MALLKVVFKFLIKVVTLPFKLIGKLLKKKIKDNMKDKKKKPSQKTAKFRKGFRKLDNKEVKGHPTYIYARVGNDYKFLGLTHSSITDNVKNIKLEKNPNPKDNRTAYVRPKTGRANRSSFKERLENWKFSEQDKKRVNEKKTFRKTLKGKPIQEKFLRKTKTRLNKWDMRKLVKNKSGGLLFLESPPQISYIWCQT